MENIDQSTVYEVKMKFIYSKKVDTRNSVMSYTYPCLCLELQLVFELYKQISYIYELYF